MHKRIYIIIGLMLLLVGLVVVVFRATVKPDIVTTDGNVSMEVATRMARVAKQEFRHDILSTVSWRDFKSLPFHWRRYWRAEKVFVGVQTNNSERIYRVVVWNDPKSYEFVTYRMRQEGDGWKILSKTGQAP